MLRTALAALFLACPLAAPAAASTMPLADFEPGVTVAIGVPDANVDVALGDRLSVGLTGYAVPLGDGWPFVSGGARATYRLLGGPQQPSLGLSVSGGYAPAFLFDKNVPWGQLALTAALPFGRTGWTLRGSLGPMLYRHTYTTMMLFAQNFPTTETQVLLVPNLELAGVIGPGQELTLGGNSLIGWRCVL
jgi:hypothetical protein